jgi:FtsZ-binding cell division protein ZapB
VQRLVTATFASAIPKNAPEEIVYLPVGSHTITPTVDGKAKTITIHIRQDRMSAIAAALQSDLEKRLAGPVRPFLGFDHSRTGPAAGIPKRFSFDDRGIILATDWSTSGRAGVEGSDYGYLSGTFLVDDQGEPCGLPSKGEIGSLVNEPAFRSIGLIAAADTDPNPESNTNTTMSKLIFAALAISAAAENAETEAVKAIDRLQVEASDAKSKAASLEEENKGLKTKVEAAEAEAKKTRKDRADTLVKAAVADGRIAPKDEDKQTKFRDKIEAGDTFAEEILAQLPKLNQGLDKAIVLAADGKPVQASDFEGKAQALVTAGQAKTLDEALGQVAAADPTAYTAYLSTLG